MTHQKITVAAVELFERQGYESTTVQQIVDRAQVAKGTFFNYFVSKEDLVMELQKHVTLKHFENVSGIAGPIIPLLHNVLLEHARQYLLNPSATRAVLQGIFNSPRMRSAQSERCMELRKSLTPFLDQAQTLGELRKDISADTIALLAVQTYFGALMVWSMGDDQNSLYDRMVQTFELFVQGVHPQR